MQFEIIRTAVYSCPRLNISKKFRNNQHLKRLGLQTDSMEYSMDRAQTPEAAGNITHPPIYTPRTPALREHRQRFSLRPMHSVLANQPTESDSDIADALEELTKKTWSIWGVSALFGFQYDEVKLKQYAKRLREEVARSLTKEDVTYDAKFTTLENLALGPTDNPAIKVVVNAVTEEDGNEKCIYRGIFLSWRTTGDTDNNRQWVKLPVLLCYGNESVMKAVHSVFGRMFDCTIISLPATQDDLMWLVPIVLNIGGGSKRQKMERREVVMEYRVPGLPATDSITVRFPIPKVKTLWTKVCQKEENEIEGEEFTINAEDVELFHECLKDQFLTISSIHLGLCVLHKISLPSLVIAGKKMKVMNTEAMDRVLLFLQEKASAFLHSFDWITNSSYDNNST